MLELNTKSNFACATGFDMHLSFVLSLSLSLSRLEPESRLDGARAQQGDGAEASA